MSRSTIRRHIDLERERILKKFKGDKGEGTKEKNETYNCENAVITVHDNFSENVENSGLVTRNSEGNQTIQEILKVWYHKYNPTRERLHGLLHILNAENLNVPLSLSGLLKEKKEKTIIRTVTPGTYYHLGLKRQLEKLPQSIIKDYNQIIVDICVDGLPLYKKFWSFFVANNGKNCEHSEC